MRADRPEVDLLVFDEPASGSPVCVHRLSHPLQTSSLDAHAQNNTVDTIQRISASPSGHRSKTVIFITHRLSTARRADKIAMMERGVRLSVHRLAQPFMSVSADNHRVWYPRRAAQERWLLCCSIQGFHLRPSQNTPIHSGSFLAFISTPCINTHACIVIRGAATLP